MAHTRKSSTRPNHMKDILLLLSVPTAVIILLAGLVYVPRLLANPSHDFIYSVCPDYDCNEAYVDSDGNVAERSHDKQYYSRSYAGTPDLRYYDVSEQESRMLAWAEAADYRLDSSSRAPDGYELTKDSGSRGFLFWHDNDDGWYLQNGMAKKAVTLEANQYYDGITFLGWVRQ